jgi:predicted GH43/DUF377 family glycosyl hydrolase
MRITTCILILLVLIIFPSCKSGKTQKDSIENRKEFPEEVVEFNPFEQNPVFSGTDMDTWDQHIRERGYILIENGLYKMWYTGYTGGDDNPKSLGYATSTDGINWIRYPGNPIFSEKWTEDMFVIRYMGKYYMYAEGFKDIAHLLTSVDGINWQEKGDLVIRKANGDTIAGPYGTPTVWIENEKWYLFYERNDEAIWLAISNDQINWTNIQDEPVLKKGPEIYDSGAVAANQVIKYKGKYYMYYHGSSNVQWNIPGVTSLWTSNAAMSSDLVHWVKYPRNPIVEGDHSSPIVIHDRNGFRLYTMHDKVWLYYGK